MEDASALIDLMRDKQAYVVDGHHRVSAASEMWKRNGETESFSKLLLLFSRSANSRSAFIDVSPIWEVTSLDELTQKLPHETSALPIMEVAQIQNQKHQGSSLCMLPVSGLLLSLRECIQQK